MKSRTETSTDHFANDRNLQHKHGVPVGQDLSRQPAAVVRRQRYDRADSEGALLAGIRLQGPGDHQDVAKAVPVFRPPTFLLEEPVSASQRLPGTAG
jgi:hypothetical protein